MNISLVEKATALTNPAIPSIGRVDRKHERFTFPETGIDEHIIAVVQRAGSSNLQISNHAKAQLRALPVSLATKLRWGEVGMAAKAVYRLKLMTPKALLENIARGILKNLPRIQALETSQGKGVAGRIMLGGLLDPGIRLETLTEQDFAVASISEALRGEASRGNPALAMLFSKSAPKKFTGAESINELARAIAEARLRPHMGYCGNEIVTPDNTNLLKQF